MSHGGRIVNWDDPKLTHILIDKRDTSRRLELMKKTSTFVFFVLFLPPVS